jgi:hypothetical protein
MGWRLKQIALMLAILAITLQGALMAGVITPAQYVGGGGGGAVSSVFGRTGAVTAQTGDYMAAQVGADAAGAAAALNLGSEAYISGQLLCAPSVYAPGSQTPFSTSSSTMSAVSSSHVNTGSFVAPASGIVQVTAWIVAYCASSGDHMAFALSEHGSVSAVSNYAQFENNGLTDFYIIPFLVSGLTPGDSYNFDLMYSSPDGGEITVYALGITSDSPASGSGSPVIMTVQAI